MAQVKHFGGANLKTLLLVLLPESAKQAGTKANESILLSLQHPDCTAPVNFGQVVSCF